MSEPFAGALLPEREGKRIALVGIGNELNGDDAAGVLVVRRLKEVLSTGRGAEGAAFAGASALLLIEGGAAPESFSGPLRRFQPDWVIFIDAAHLGEEPGSMAWIAWQEVGGLSASTHTLPPSLLAQFLMREVGCRVAMIGIQPEHLDLDVPVSVAVEGAVERLVKVLAEWVSGQRG